MLFRNQILDNIIASFNLYLKKKTYCQKTIKDQDTYSSFENLKTILFHNVLVLPSKDKHSWYAGALYDSQTIRVGSFFYSFQFF